MSDLQEVITSLVRFRDERNWKQFHNPKDLAIALNIECGELLELFLWKGSDQVNVEHLKDELADVFSYAFLLANHYSLNITEIVENKIEKNSVRYPVEKARDSAKKYNEL